LTANVDPAKKKMVMVSSGQPSLNPRLVKEADTLTAAGFDVTVLYAYWNAWGTHLDEKLIPGKKWKCVRAGGDPEQKKFTYLLSRIIHKFSLWVTKHTGIKYFAQFAIARSSYFLIREAKKHKADLYIGHNLGALPAAVKASKKHKKPCGFDAEDFHRYETLNNNNDKEVILKAFIEDKYIPQVSYLSASSTQIANAYQQLFPDKKPVTLLNVFPFNNAVKQPQLNVNQPVKLFWFSQVIGVSRGVEDIVKALHFLKDENFELHLLGYHSSQSIDFIEQLNNGVAKIFYHQPVMPGVLVEFAAQFDIGLATEPGFSINNDFALSNKIFTYMQAGLAIATSDTTAQSALLNQYPAIGSVYQKGNVQSLADVLSAYNKNRGELLEKREASWLLAKNTLNWENESERFLGLVKQTLNNDER
jgi:glycosyltransferase involved in cell wall biosynthesis